MINSETLPCDVVNSANSRCLFAFEPQLSVSEITRALRSAGLIAVPKQGVYEIRRAKK